MSTVRASAQQTIIDLTDAYNVYLTCASYTFPGTTTGAKAGSCTTQVMAMQGTDQASAVVDTSKCVCPAGVTVSSDADATAPTLTISVTTAVTKPGKVTIPVTVDGQVEFTLEFAFGIALTGAKGDAGTSVKISSTAIEYQVGASGTTAPTGTWSTSVQTPGQNQYLWTRTTVRYTDGNSTVSYSVSRNPANGSNGTSVSITGTSTTYQVGTSGTSAPTGTWLTAVPSVPQGQYLWTRTVVSYSDGKSTTSYAVSRQGVNGSNGADAISMVITSSNGLIFKNAKISTTLTAHVYRGGAELDATGIAKLGTIRWYKDGSSTAAGTGATLSVSADSVNVRMNVVAQLEG